MARISRGVPGGLSAEVAPALVIVIGVVLQAGQGRGNRRETNQLGIYPTK